MGYKGYIGAFVPADYASPCPGFNHGKTAPGGGRGSRSPETWLYLLLLFLPLLLLLQRQIHCLTAVCPTRGKKRRSFSGMMKQVKAA